MSRVFVVQEPMRKTVTGEIIRKMDLTPAESYGDLVYLLSWSDVKYLDPDAMVWKVRERMVTFTPDDYLLLVGNPTAIAVAASVAAEVTDGCYRVLHWERAQHRYHVLTVDLNRQPLNIATGD